MYEYLELRLHTIMSHICFIAAVTLVFLLNQPLNTNENVLNETALTLLQPHFSTELWSWRWAAAAEAVNEN